MGTVPFHITAVLQLLLVVYGQDAEELLATELTGCWACCQDMRIVDATATVLNQRHGLSGSEAHAGRCLGVLSSHLSTATLVTLTKLCRIGTPTWVGEQKIGGISHIGE